MLERGLVQIYTGDGKGKTTAAFGLALRAAGQGHKVLIYQFLKPPSLNLGERKALESFKSIKVETLNIEWDMRSPASGQSPRRGSLKDPAAIKTAQNAIHKLLKQLSQSAAKRQFDVLVLDEIVYCLSQNLAKIEDIKELLKNKDEHTEIIMTGRGATPELIALADLVTEMRLIKHPYDKGIPARKGIEF
jgi:cob(I)alamin adenosyltransferase